MDLNPSKSILFEEIFYIFWSRVPCMKRFHVVLGASSTPKIKVKISFRRGFINRIHEVNELRIDNINTFL